MCLCGFLSTLIVMAQLGYPPQEIVTRMLGVLLKLAPGYSRAMANVANPRHTALLPCSQVWILYE
jgi:hypothetical protein